MTIVLEEILVDKKKKPQRWRVRSALRELGMFALIVIAVFTVGMIGIYYRSFMWLLFPSQEWVYVHAAESVSSFQLQTVFGATWTRGGVDEWALMNQLDQQLAKTEISLLSADLRKKDILSYLKTAKKNIDFPLNTLPPETRVTIPSIGVTAPIIMLHEPPEEKLLAADFGDELEKWVVQYPGTAWFGREWASLVFGHSSTFPWEKNKYGDIFSSLPDVEAGEEIVVYSNSQVHTYEIQEIKFVRPKEVPDLYEEYNDEDGHTLILMACYPIFTDAQRILVIAKEKK